MKKYHLDAQMKKKKKSEKKLKNVTYQLVII